ncbi:MarR family winged helix-turn-helix transcriptional regulator [Chelatococcus asaccharovorans]|uniref:MarR family transcriptional regulator n=1 Tax=Chelatococcus asaccharovorans TaxID=28210 RepID=A0A2V3UA25_9HYPH|nr:MarR family winged helix-turn-helix transcriptional regulator [Chelatococcus asaccharovorans]MBS7705337.1 winged helix-turn-helix transcriptional regulator [Chelatococcus asaccharovorans]PXW60260.1 MarR family transcriptional regulator [Chelatococcus asaccharovorans]CAH1654856.1 MarR family transcriptional regulator [Chelatococcus asaccharovorans]CAH1685619.1 MarR family transcriptional regulator [Chelatococcus asaccharovorans]
MSTPCHCTNLRIATRKVAALYDAALSPVGINIAQYALLRTIARRQPISLTELAKHLELDRSTMGRNVRVIQKLGLVELGRGEDQREATVTLSEHGSTVLRKAEPLWDRCQDEIGERLGPTRVELIAELSQLL